MADIRLQNVVKIYGVSKKEKPRRRLLLKEKALPAKRAIDEIGRDSGFWLGCNKFVTYENDMNSENLKAVSDFVMEYKG